MKFTQDKNIYILRLDRGEDLISSIEEFCQKHNISNGYFSGIGAVDNLSCGYYSLEEKKYYFRQYTEMLEVVSLTGNIYLKEGKPFVHVHGVFTDKENKAFGGHIERAQVGLVLELVINVTDTSVERKFDETTGLGILNFS